MPSRSINFATGLTGFPETCIVSSHETFLERVAAFRAVDAYAWLATLIEWTALLDAIGQLSVKQKVFVRSSWRSKAWRDFVGSELTVSSLVRVKSKPHSEEGWPSGRIRAEWGFTMNERQWELYRLSVVEEWPGSSYKAAVIGAIKHKLMILDLQEKASIKVLDPPHFMAKPRKARP